MLRFSIALALSLVCFIVPAWADYQTGMEANNRGDFATALREWGPLAEKGDASAQYSLGVLYDKGQGVPQDHVQARQWYEKAAAQDYAEAAVSLGTVYLNGYGVSQDYQKALFWFRRAIDQGNAMAQWKLGLMYELGRGVPQDFVQAHMWYNLAAANGAKEAAKFRDGLAKQMTPAQIAEAQKVAREWKPKSP